MRIPIPCAVLFLLACTESQRPLFKGTGAPGSGDKPTIQTSLSVPLPSQRPIDLLFAIDNSASMAAKQDLLLENLSKMMQALENLDGGLPDVRIGVVSTDLGAGEGVAGGDCSARLGDQGLLWGNDPTPGALATVAGSPANGCGLMTGVRWIEDRLCPDGSRRYRNYEGKLADVLSCMGKALGNHGCGYSHALQSLRLALNPIQGINDANLGFLRRRAPLVIIIISDNDDCSADPSNENNDGMFSAKNPGDSPTLRCAARGHVCEGRAIPNYDPATGYDGSQGPWTTAFGSCSAKEPTTNRDSHWLPLISVQDAIDSVRQVKESPDLISVVGVIGWPDAIASAQSQFEIDRAAGTGSWELSPICGAFSVQGEGADVYPAYRLKRFVDAFPSWDGDQWRTISMCNRYWKEAIFAVSYGTVWSDKMRPPCLRDPLTDVDPNTPGIQPDCQVTLWSPGDDSGECGGQPAHEEIVPECLDPATRLPIDPDNFRPRLDAIPEARRPCWYLVRDRNPTTGCPDASDHQTLALLFKTGHVPPPRGMWTATCQTDPRP